MEQEKKIHLLSQELIPIINDIEKESRKIIVEHSQGCEECKELLSKVIDFDNEFPEHEISDDVEIKPLKKLAQFNRGLKLLLIAVRGIILFFILYSSLKYYRLESAELIVASLQGSIYLFYFPAAVFLLVFTYTFFNKKWIWISLAVDIIIIFFLDNIFQLFI